MTVRAVLAGSVIVKGEKLMAYSVAADVGGTFTDVLLFIVQRRNRIIDY
ncbi:MAG: hypothetical protein M1493_00015 [Firmicutes bacterium]|nr:hypothetical protein [Bacillota bacterium]